MIFANKNEEVWYYINRVYAKGLTTTSGGNLSIIDENGNIWITPSGKDKGTLAIEDITQVKPNGEIVGLKPSIELPFHSLIYKLRTDVNAVLHVHSPYLVTYSLFNNAPPTTMMPSAYHACGNVGLSRYDIPGSIELGAQIAKFIEQGYDSIMMENHGVVLVAPTMEEAYTRLEALENCAKTGVKAARLGKIKTLTQEELEIYKQKTYEQIEDIEYSDESFVKNHIYDFAKRCYQHDLFQVGSGCISHRLGDDSFIITPQTYDRAMCEKVNFVKVIGGKTYGGVPDKLTEVHREIYAQNPYCNCIFSATPPNTMAYAVTGTEIDSRTIPESYINMRDVIRVDFGEDVSNLTDTAKKFQPAAPIMIVNNAHIIATGETIIKAFDRLEVTEATAKTLITGLELGMPTKISDKEIDKINQAFNLPNKI